MYNMFLNSSPKIPQDPSKYIEDSMSEIISKSNSLYSQTDFINFRCLRASDILSLLCQWTSEDIKNQTKTTARHRLMI